MLDTTSDQSTHPAVETTGPVPGERLPVVEAGREAARVAAAHADEVDRDGRFPHEAVAALREHGLLSAGFPVELGGRGASLTELAAVARALGGACASTGMVFAMHQSQALILGHHAGGTPTEPLVRRVVEQEQLVASATTEITTSGDIRRSTCAVERVEGSDPALVHLEKNAPVISYGEHADVVCVTARRDADAEPSDQVLLVCPREDLTMTPTFPWEVMGFRGTCSPGFLLDATTSADHVMDVDYATISAETVLPTAHVLWASTWLGMADAAVDKVRAEVRKAARKSNGTPPQALRLADLVLEHQRFEAAVEDGLRRYEAVLAGEAGVSMNFTIALNNLKRISSEAVRDVTLHALEICGLSGYRLGHPAGMDRLLRDALGPQLMVSNERIRANTSELVLAWRR